MFDFNIIKITKISKSGDDVGLHKDNGDSTGSNVRRGRGRGGQSNQKRRRRKPQNNKQQQQQQQ